MKLFNFYFLSFFSESFAENETIYEYDINDLDPGNRNNYLFLSGFEQYLLFGRDFL